MKYAAIAVSIAFVGCVTSAAAQIAPDPAEGDRMAAVIRSGGWACGRVVYIEQTRKTSNGSTFYKLICDWSGPNYQLERTADGKQLISPLE